MKVICSWCDKDLGEKEPLADTRVSHGICEDCRKKIMRGMKDERDNSSGVGSSVRQGVSVCLSHDPRA